MKHYNTIDKHKVVRTSESTIQYKTQQYIVPSKSQLFWSLPRSASPGVGQVQSPSRIGWAFPSGGATRNRSDSYSVFGQVIVPPFFSVVMVVVEVLAMRPSSPKIGVYVMTVSGGRGSLTTEQSRGCMQITKPKRCR